MTIGLCMIVKDEAENLPRLAASVREQIDTWLILDTGSTDDTREVAEKEFGALPGSIIEHEWDYFGPTRNQAMELIRPHCDWVLMMDADEELVGELDLYLPPGANAVGAKLTSAHQPTSWKPRLTRSKDAWRWKGRTHENFLSPVGMTAQIYASTSFSVVHHSNPADGYAKSVRDLELLRLDLADDPYDPRAIYYVAATLEGMREYAEALTWYKRRARLRGDDTEYSHALLGLARCTMKVEE